LNFTGTTLIRAPQQQVWDVLLSPEALHACLPGCKRFEEIVPDTYEATVTLGIAAVKGTYNGRVTITERDEPNSYKLNIEGSGTNATVRGTGSISLAPTADGTNVQWTTEAQVGGPIASVGQRLLSGVAKVVAGEFFKCMERRLSQPEAANASAEMAEGA
jgi:carbon monoxide dehydrogenase subunit G